MILCASAVLALSIPFQVSPETNSPPAPGAAVLAWADFDRDGREDVYVVRGSAPDQLLRNTAEGGFEEVALSVAPAWSRSATWADFDGDGFADLLLCGSVSGVRLFANLGGGRFEERTDAAGIAGIVGTRDARVFDMDGDRRLDVTLQGAGDPLLLRNVGGGAFAVLRLVAPTASEPAPAAELAPSATVPALRVDAPPTSGRVPLTGPTAPVLRAGHIAQGSPTSGKQNAMPSFVGVPSGYMILGDTPVAPQGYTATGIVAKPDTWTFRRPMSASRNFHATAAVGTKIYVIGGMVSGIISSTVEEYDTVADAWSAKAPMSASRLAPAAAAVDGKIFAMGGQHASGPVLATMEEYDPVANAWTPRASLPAPRAYLAAATANGKIYAIGGQDASFQHIAAVDEFDPATNSWTNKASLPVARSEHAVAVANGKIYVVGGTTPSGISASVLEYDPTTNVWTAKGSMPMSITRSAAAPLNGTVFLLGGVAAIGDLNTTWRYDPTADTWTIGASLLEGRQYLAAAAANGGLFVFGGSNTALVEEYDPVVLYAFEKN